MYWALVLKARPPRPRPPPRRNELQQQQQQQEAGIITCILLLEAAAPWHAAILETLLCNQLMDRLISLQQAFSSSPSSSSSSSSSLLCHKLCQQSWSVSCNIHDAINFHFYFYFVIFPPRHYLLFSMYFSNYCTGSNK
jgi:hypothetical protein